MKRLALTDLKIATQRLPKKSALTKSWTEADISAKFAASSWGKKIAKQAAKKNLSDISAKFAASSWGKKIAKQA